MRRRRTVLVAGLAAVLVAAVGQSASASLADVDRYCVYARPPVDIEICVDDPVR